MSSSALMSIGTRAMFANYASMQTTGHNIANAQTPGYSRQTVELQTSGGQQTGAGFFGKGVDVVTVQRASDAFLTTQSQVASSMAAMDSTRSANLQQLETVFPPGDNGMGASVGNFMNAFVDLANSPADSSARQVILSDAAEVADRFATAGGQLDRLQNGVTSDLKNSVAQVNQMAAQVAKLNGDIAALRGTSSAPNDLLDQRDQLVKQIGNLVKVSTVQADDGTMGVFIAGGQRLVLGAEAQQLAVTPDPANTGRSTISISDSGITHELSTDLLVGGSISGLMKYQNEDLVAARNQLGQMAAAVSARVNQVQAAGIDMSSPAGSGNPVFAVGGPIAIPNVHNARDASGGFAASVSMTVTDGSQLKASDYTLAADPATPGNFVVTRQSDGVKFSMAPDGAGGFGFTRQSDGAAMGSSMDGFQITFSGTPAANDSFELEPVGRAAVSMQRVLDDPAGLAAAAPQTAVMGVANKGTATVSGLTVVDPSSDPTLTTSINFTDAAGGYSYTLTDASGAVTSSGTGTWTPGQPIALNGYQLSLNGVPANGDTLTVTKTAHPESNNGNALAMVGLRDEAFVGRDKQIDGSLQDGETATDAYASVLANVGVRVQSAKTASTISQATSDQAADAVADKSGVNLDEEAGRLIQFQQGYQAAAKVLQVAQAIFDTLLQMASH
ncbi:flagellar hook-associated protein FlgK [Scleromatobacter humisilvae]|uniref:Flagellar hook-associated protein 1 n=1 Tax=Scleromatobacter humisilvae TaxID=2897159 RepID=A0A9X1YGU4_9BURK|nr:flagellar hook-associated protein FlgK [Scleromatobacter humisilvae]MCK9684595.1 flagellar hook-associated protein FlgK [Scleromatobacter humisilvae]